MITIIEPVLYLYPHKEELVKSSLSMKGTWRFATRLLKEKNTFLAPLLIDDLKRNEYLCYQSVDDILKETIGKKYNELPWFGDSVLESNICNQYGNLGCKLFDSLYHKDILCSLFISGMDWKWIVVHPICFKKQQSGMILNLWKMLSEIIRFELVANRMGLKSEAVRYDMRTAFLSRFNHYWINDKGEIEEVTSPTYIKKEITHEKVQVHSMDI